VLLQERLGAGFQLVGDAWMYGFMMGEELKDAKEEDWVQLAIH
jgi:hypothetical protein